MIGIQAKILLNNQQIIQIQLKKEQALKTQQEALHHQDQKNKIRKQLKRLIWQAVAIRNLETTNKKGYQQHNLAIDNKQLKSYKINQVLNQRQFFLRQQKKPIKIQDQHINHLEKEINYISDNLLYFQNILLIIQYQDVLNQLSRYRIIVIIILTDMKPNIPAGNAIIATLYLLITIAFFYVVKLVYKSNHKKGKTSPKYTNANLNKGLTSPLMQNHIQPTKMLIKAYALKYSVIGTFLNLNKCYMLKQIFILSIISIACSSINSITVYPIAFAIVFSIIFFVTMQVAKLPFYWNISTQIDEQRKIINNQVASQQIQIQPGLVVNSNNNYQSYNQPAKQENTINNQYSYKYSMYVAVISFITLILISQTMFTIYNSISNLGALNLGSVVIVVVIDQLGIRPIFGLLLLAAQKIINHLAQNQEDRTLNSQQLQNEARSSNKLKIFQFNLFKNLCQDLLIARMNQLYQQHGEPSNYSMGASPTKKKTFSPSKVPKAQPDQQTLMNLNVTKNLEEALQIEKIVQQVVEQNVQEQKSPIKQIQMSMIKQSMLFTSIEKQMFGEDNQNDQLQCNKTTNVQLQKIKINPNQYFSVQRLPKDQLNHQQHIQDDGLVLIEAGLNLVKQKQMKQKPNTIDIDFSPTKKRKKTVGAYPKRRQLIITGSSPYLEYLPDMMKKQKQNKKNLTPSSHQQISTISRKVL